MWEFAVTLFLLRLFPESLLLVGVYGLIMQLAVVVFGTIVGDWVDTSARIKGRYTYSTSIHCVIWLMSCVYNTKLLLIN